MRFIEGSHDKNIPIVCIEQFLKCSIEKIHFEVLAKFGPQNSFFLSNERLEI